LMGSSFSLKGVFVLAVIHAKAIPTTPAKKVVQTEMTIEFLIAWIYLEVVNNRM